MNRAWHKYAFIVVALLLLAMMLYRSREAGVSCDEVLHYNQSVKVYNYFRSGGTDRTALQDSEQYLKYYGQSYDNITTFLIKSFGIEDIYSFRHLMSSLAGWLAIIVTAIFAVWLSGYSAGLLVLLLFAVSPTFLGHSQNNLKDIPFALGYISGIFFTLRFLFSDKKLNLFDIILLILSIAFCMSIRAGGMMLIVYLLAFFFLTEFIRYFNLRTINLVESGRKFGIIILISVAAWFLSVVFWPYGLQNPIINPVKAHIVMSRFPLTFREIFEGKTEWTDFMPWYYLLKYMLITFPLTVVAGLVFLVVYLPCMVKKPKFTEYMLLSLTVILPILYEIIFKPNIYSGWRQFLFLYPGIVIFSAKGINGLFSIVPGRYKLVMVLLLLLTALHPLKFIITDFRYAYIYFNPVVGGLKGANGNYETDYYFIGQREAAEWLGSYLQSKNVKDTVIVGSNFSTAWYFRNNPLVKNITFRNEERSNFDWDYYLSTNRYILPFRLKNGEWPPQGALKVVYADGAPVCAVIERKSKDSYYGFKALQERRVGDAVNLFKKAVEENGNDEMIFYNFAVALNRAGDSLKADSVLMKSLEINPFFEPALMYAGMISESKGRYDEAEGYYKRLIEINRKYSEAYVRLAGIVERKDVVRARAILRECLRINPVYRTALIRLADTYRGSHPEIARKYDSLAAKIGSGIKY
ncbi:MAG TPA: hypothetical protein PL101_07245 [Bacteroidales bacterium]|nr:hypothetical protein [Bacteroidales bacterium]